MEASAQFEPPSSRALAAAEAPSGSASAIALWASGLLLALGCAYAIALCSCSPDVGGHALGSDDAFISYRYARNWVEGHGIVFNVGERVEGYTNFLYVALMTIPFLLGLDVLHFSVVVNTLFALGAWWLFVRHLQSRHGTRAALVGGYLFAPWRRT
jgi:hypothetical protein